MEKATINIGFDRKEYDTLVSMIDMFGDGRITDDESGEVWKTLAEKPINFDDLPDRTFDGHGYTRKQVKYLIMTLAIMGTIFKIMDKDLKDLKSLMELEGRKEADNEN